MSIDSPSGAMAAAVVAEGEGSPGASGEDAAALDCWTGGGKGLGCVGLEK